MIKYNPSRNPLILSQLCHDSYSVGWMERQQLSCFCICCQNWLSACPWLTVDSALYYQYVGSLVAEYPIVLVMYCVAFFSWKVLKETNTLHPGAVLQSRKASCLSTVFSIDALRFGLPRFAAPFELWINGQEVTCLMSNSLSKFRNSYEHR